MRKRYGSVFYQREEQTERRITLAALCCLVSVLFACAFLGKTRGVFAFLAAPSAFLTEQRPGSTASRSVEASTVSVTAASEMLEPTQPVMLTNQPGAPTIFIYHTHATEAYFQTDNARYEESGEWRTNDETKSVIAVGEKLKEELEHFGFTVLHDTADYEPPKLATAYSRSLVAMQEAVRRYPSIRLMIDLHRDAYGQKTAKPADYLTIDGRETARIMFVVGKGSGETGAGYAELPDFASNYALAERITAILRKTDTHLARDIRVKNGRYNQHVLDQCLLVEVGHNANTLEQAFNAVPYLADAIAQCVDPLVNIAADESIWAAN